MADTNNNEVPTGSQGVPHPELFDLRAMPPFKLPLKPGQLNESQIRQYFQKGYLIVPEFFKPEELEACRREIEVLVDGLAQDLYDNGKIKDLYTGFDLFQRLTKIDQEFPGANIVMIKNGIMTRAFMDLWSNERLLNVVEQLIGPEIMGHPVWNLRTKTPKNQATTVPWHQDSAYLDKRSYEVLQPTAWIPLLDTNENNGCMQVVSGGHATGKVARHTCCWADTWYVTLEDEDMERDLNVNVKQDTVLCPVPYGGMLLINNMIPHRSLNNLSDKIRWSLDLRWQRPDKNVGFYDLKGGVLLRSETDPVHAIDWDGFNGVDRHVQQTKDCEGAEEVAEEDRFDTTIVGPWMKKWPMTHTNRHTAKLARSEMSWHKA